MWSCTKGQAFVMWLRHAAGCQAAHVEQRLEWLQFRTHSLKVGQLMITTPRSCTYCDGFKQPLLLPTRPPRVRATALAGR